MVATKTCVNFLVSLSLVIMSLFPYESAAAAPKFTVSISNYLGKDSTPATVHCYSPPLRDNPATVIQWGQAYVWDFRTALGIQAQFTCDISSGSKTGKFLIFDLKRDKPRCTNDRNCFWRIYPDGLYQFIAPTNSYEKQFAW